MNSNVGPSRRAGFMPHVNAPNVVDGDGDVGTALGLLVKLKEIDDARIFVCPSSTDIPVLIDSTQALNTFNDGSGPGFDSPDGRLSRPM